MPLLQAQTISHQFDNGDTLFKQLSCVMTARRVGLVGRNGAGKSILTAILSGKITPTSGKVSVTTSLGVFRQQSQHTLADSVSIA